LYALIYRYCLRPIFFLFESENIHNRLTAAGHFYGQHDITKKTIGFFLRVKDPILSQTRHGLRFENPIGLAAGFDYNCQLPKILPSLGFGFGTVGTITNRPYEGNPPPRLGRLIKSRSLMVNKGFKNAGIDAALKKLGESPFDIPIGLSIGKTNTQEPMTQAEAEQDIAEAFSAAHNSHAAFSHYELNISCPNLYGNIDFYLPAHLQSLLREVFKISLTKPVFIKMPISQSDEETRRMLSVIVQFPVSAVIFGNLQTNRNDASLRPDEVMKYNRGYFSGKPTEKRSNELIQLAYSEYGQQLTIIGCGGVFGGSDAYKKIKLGASLVQLVTGLIFMGPQLPAEMNMELSKLIKQDGFNNISEAIGIAAK